MRRFSIAVFIATFLIPLTALAENPTIESGESATSISPGQLMPTPDMWFYEQYQQQYQNPQAMVRKNAENRAAQRQQRLAALRWFGMSNSRPTCSSDPVHSDWSASWKSNNTFYPSRWTAVGRPWVVITPGVGY